MAKDTDDRWTPVRRGSIYCSPACGGSCTLAAYQKACTDAVELVASIGGVGWKTNVWENLGWHWSVFSKTGHIVVHPSTGDSYMVGFCLKPFDAGMEFCVHVKKPKDGIASIAVTLKAKADAALAALESIK